MELRTVADDAVAEAIGRNHRTDPVIDGSGGPAGNARLTAWTGIVLLVLFAAELITLLDVHQLISWHVFVGVALIPPALLKTATTSWRIVRYYFGHRPYRAAGPPPLMLRLLGPVVVATTLGVLGSGLALIFMTPESARASWLGPVSVLMIHKGMFVLWGGSTGLHVLGRAVPAARLTVTRARFVPGRVVRATVLVLVIAIAALTATLALPRASSWSDFEPFDHARARPQHSIDR